MAVSEPVKISSKTNRVDSMLAGRDASAALTVADLKTDQQKQSLEELLKLLSSQIAEGPKDVTLTGQETQQQDLLSQLMGQTGDATTAALEASQFDSSNIDELFRTTIRDPLVQDVRDNIIPEISARYGNQFFSSERIGQEGRAIDTLTRTLAGERAKLVNSERDRQLQALGLFPTIANTGINAAGVADVETTKKVTEEQRQKDLMSLLLGGTGQNTFENIVTVDPGSEGFLGNFFSSAGSAAGKAVFSCWVAMVLYGFNSSITHTIRAFVSRHKNDNSPLGNFMRNYLKYGKQWAILLLTGKLPWYSMKLLWNTFYHLALQEEKGVKI